MRQNGKISDNRASKLDLAARAGWLYYIARNTQDEIAEKLNVSRQAAQRLVSLAVSERLIVFRLDHHIGECEALADALRERFDLRFCDVAPSSGDAGAGDDVRGIAVHAARHLESYLVQKAPLVLALATGRTLCEMVRQVPRLSCPQHKIVSLVGNMARDGRASHYEVVMRLADRVGAQCFPMPSPIVAETREERLVLTGQRSFQTVCGHAANAKVAFVGIGEVGWDGPLHRDGFVDDEELRELVEEGAIGDTSGWVFDEQGKIVKCPVSDRFVGIPLEIPPKRLTIAVAGGVAKVPAIRAALAGRLVSGLITDEVAASAILEMQ